MNGDESSISVLVDALNAMSARIDMLEEMEERCAQCRIEARMDSLQARVIEAEKRLISHQTETPMITHPQVRTMGMKPEDFREVSPDEHYKTFRALLDEPLALRDYEPDELDEFFEKNRCYRGSWANPITLVEVAKHQPIVKKYIHKFLNFIYYRSVTDWLEDIREGETLEDTRTKAEKAYDELYTKKATIIPPEEEEEYYGEGDA